MVITLVLVPSKLADIPKNVIYGEILRSNFIEITLL